MTGILVLGGTGRLGRELVPLLPGCAAPSHTECDVTDPGSVAAALARHDPEIVVHAAGWVDVRGCERDRARAWANNVEGTHNVVKALRNRGSTRLVYISTACVFAGDRGDYTEEDIPAPVNFYGLTKLVGEQLARTVARHLVVRTDFVARAPWPHPGAFTDRFSTSVFADRLAPELSRRILAGEEGLLHLCGSEKVSHYDLARRVSPDVKPVSLSSVRDLPLPRDQSLRSVRGGEVLELA